MKNGDAQLVAMARAAFLVIEGAPWESCPPEACGYWIEGMRAARSALGIADEECLVPPPGWRCTRGRGHDGPCAAVPA